MAKYYAHISGATQVTTNFEPYASYTGNGNYLRLEYNGDNYPVSARDRRNVWRINNSGWFSFEAFDSNSANNQYVNIGSGTLLGKNNNWNTSGFENTAIFTLDNGSLSMVLGSQTVSTTFGGSPSKGNLPFFPTSEADSLEMDFYRLRVYGQNDTLLYEFVPYLSGGTKGLYDTVNGEFFSAAVQNNITLISMSAIEVEPTAITSTYSGSTSSITLTIDEGLSWSATTIPSWISLSSTAGTESADITATITQNNTYSQRTGTIVFTASNGDTAEIECTQDKHPILVPVNKIYRGGQLVD